jgi:phosphatidate cytidylyltransferase
MGATEARMSRFLTALVAVPLLLLLILKGPAWLFLVVAAMFALAGFWELSRLADKVGWKLLPVGYALSALSVCAFYPGFPGFHETGPAILLAVGLAAVFTRRPGRETLGAVTATVFAVLYGGALLGTIVGLRTMAPDDELGRTWLVFLLAVTMVGDAGAYFVGRALGRHSLAPVLSPKKTVEGLAGGIVFSVGTAALVRHLALAQLGVATAVGLGLSMAILGVVGDLFESLLKRSAGIKDTSSLLPGHGGVLDRIDSLLFAAPFLYLYLKWTEP